MNTPNPELRIPAAGRQRARYSDQFKRQVVAGCHTAGVSKAAIALANGLNARQADGKHVLPIRLHRFSTIDGLAPYEPMSPS